MTNMPLRSITRDLTRSADFTPNTPAGDGRSLTGYAAVFAEPTEINSWEGIFTETIRKGAFKKSIRDTTPVMQFDHGHHPLIGSIPIGAISALREDDQGLYVEAELSQNWLIEPVREAIAQQTVSGMSFRFTVVRDEWRDKDGKRLDPDQVLDLLWVPGDRGPLQRELIELKVAELGPVVFPAYAGTSVDVRAQNLAQTIAGDPQKAQEARHSLANDTAALGQPTDPTLRRQVAEALLFHDTTRTVALAPEDADRLRGQIRETAGLMKQLNKAIREGQ